MDVDSSSQEEASAVQVYWTPNLGCNLRVDLNTGVPEYHNYLKSASWITRRALRTVGDGGEVVYAKQRSRVFPENAPVASLKITPESAKPPLTPRGQLDMRISLVTPCMERWMLISPSNKKS